MKSYEQSLGLVIPAGGKGIRFGTAIPKQFELLNGIPIIIRTLRNFEILGFEGHVVIPVNNMFKDLLARLLKDFPVNLEILLAEGGETRQESVFNALRTNEITTTDYVFVHDAVRPFFTKSTFQSVLKAAVDFGGAVPGIKPKDTIKALRENEMSDYTPDRNILRAIQTPQCFKTGLLIQAYKKAKEEGYLGTDDASLFEYSNYAVKIVDGDEINFKITTQTDLKFAEYLINEKARR